MSRLSYYTIFIVLLYYIYDRCQCSFNPLPISLCVSFFMKTKVSHPYTLLNVFMSCCHQWEHTFVHLVNCIKFHNPYTLLNVFMSCCHQWEHIFVHLVNCIFHCFIFYQVICKHCCWDLFCKNQFSSNFHMFVYLVNCIFHCFIFYQVICKYCCWDSFCKNQYFSHFQYSMSSSPMTISPTVMWGIHST